MCQLKDLSRVHDSSDEQEPPLRVPTPLEQREAAGVVLVADDEPCAREPTAELLKRAGYRILTASDSKDTISVFKEHADEIVAVLLDYHMPGGPGDEVFEELQAIQPGVPVIMMSAFVEEETKGRFLGMGIVGFLQKPFGRAALLDKVRDAVDPSAA